ncbi:MAG: hypothetical protein KAI90_02830, partial [Desulfobulbaceae bacterium]|nr:hypothetical protein [Desulfobulbaceae bacterium]
SLLSHFLRWAMKLLDSIHSGSNFVFLVNGVNESGANYPHFSKEFPVVGEDSERPALSLNSLQLPDYRNQAFHPALCFWTHLTFLPQNRLFSHPAPNTCVFPVSPCDIAILV